MNDWKNHEHWRAHGKARPTRVYLAGPINGTTDRQANEWRSIVTAALKGRDVQSCDLVLAYCWQPSFGTAMELHFAHANGIEAWSVVEGKSPSPWLAYHSRVFASLGDAVLELARRVA